MPAVEIRGGVKVEIPNVKEIRDSLADELDFRQRREIAGKKRMELVIPVAGTPTTFFAGQSQGVGPEEGYVWSLKLAAAIMSSSQTLQVFKASSSGDTRRPLAALAASTIGVATWSADQARIKHGEGVYFVAGGAGITGIYLAAWQVPAEKEAEVYD